jgi:hypothetical protein
VVGAGGVAGLGGSPSSPLPAGGGEGDGSRCLKIGR